MADFVDVNKVRGMILEAISDLLSIRSAAETYAAEPTVLNCDLLVNSVDRLAGRSESLRTQLAIMVKEANGKREEILGTETDNGILLS